MKKVLSAILAALMIVTLAVGCANSSGNGGTPSNTTPGNAANPSTPPGADNTVYKIRIADTVQDDSVYTLAFNESFIPYVEEHGQGRIIIERYGNSQLGSDAQLAESLQLNTLEMAMIPCSSLGGFDADFMALDLPFLYDNAATAYAALDGEWGKLFEEKLENISIKKLGWEENSFRNFSSNVPINSLADMTGIKMRVMESTIYVETMKAFGASPTPMAFSELYSALQNGTVDGQDNGPVLTYTSKFYEVQDYYTVSEYCYAASMIAASLEWWNTLPADIQKILLDASLQFQNVQREMIQAEYENHIQLLEQNGMTIIRLTDAQKQEFREASAGVYDIMRNYIDSDIIDMALTVNETYKK